MIDTTEVRKLEAELYLRGILDFIGIDEDGEPQYELTEEGWIALAFGPVGDAA